MNTKPDDTTLALWLDDELGGEALAEVEAWATEHPEQLAAREEIRRWREMISQSLPAAEEPPAAEFFNERIQHAIRETTHSHPSPASTRSSSWPVLWMPLAACAGMVFAFWLGTFIKPEVQGRPLTQAKPRPIAAPHIYTPEQGVDAEWFSNNEASASVIVLSGVHAIPDAVDFTAAAYNSSWREIDSTAVIESKTQPE